MPKSCTYCVGEQKLGPILLHAIGKFQASFYTMLVGLFLLALL